MFGFSFDFLWFLHNSLSSAIFAAQSISAHPHHSARNKAGRNALGKLPSQRSQNKWSVNYYNGFYPVRLSFIGNFTEMQILPRLQNRVGGGITPADLSHHRTYGSVYGGFKNRFLIIRNGIKHCVSSDHLPDSFPLSGVLLLWIPAQFVAPRVILRFQHYPLHWPGLLQLLQPYL